jgi:hypothetical protein
MSSDRYTFIIKAFTDLKAELEEAEIDVSSETIATLIAADLLHSLQCTIEYKGV